MTALGGFRIVSVYLSIATPIAFPSAFKFGRKAIDLLEVAARGEIEVAVSQVINRLDAGRAARQIRILKERLNETAAVIEACTIHAEADNEAKRHSRR